MLLLLASEAMYIIWVKTLTNKNKKMENINNVPKAQKKTKKKSGNLKVISLVVLGAIIGCSYLYAYQTYVELSGFIQ